MTDITNKDSEQDVKIAVLDSTLENATRRMELIHKRIDRTDERITKLNEDVRESCLLYTSPSPRDATLSRMPSCA